MTKNENNKDCRIRMVELGDILTDAQINQLGSIINQLGHEGIDCMSPEYIKRLKEFFWEMCEELNERNIIPDYLAYAVLAEIYRRKVKV